VVRVLALLDEALGRGIFDRDDVERRFPFLEGYAEHLDELAGSHRGRHDPVHFERLADELAATAAEPPPLARLATSDIGGTVAVDVVVAAALVERDVRFGAVVAALQAPSTSRRPCIGMLGALLGAEPDAVAEAVGALVAAGLVVIDNADDPRAEQLVRLPPAVLRVLEGGQPSAPSIETFARADAPSLDDLVLSTEVAARVERVGGLIRRGDLDALIVRGIAGTGRRMVLRAVAGQQHRGVLVATADSSRATPDLLPGALALLTGAMLVWSADPGIGQLVTTHRPAGVGTIGVSAGKRGAVGVAGAERTAVVDLVTPDADQRRTFWESSGLTVGEPVLDVISRRYAFSGGMIGGVAQQAKAIAEIDGRDEVEVGDVRQAAQDHGRQRLESLATLLAPLSTGLMPVLGGVTAQGYEALVLRARHREALGDAVGGATGGQITRGVRALFSGPSGTGKTLTARALGMRLDLDVYRADLAALVDKYIGETERRLDELFTRAEELDVVLLIDEGDALMTRRTDVRSSNDRYANLETDYLLQRLETYEGIVLITTNAAHLIDTAFQRRLDVTVPFSPPGPDERKRIWDLHLPEHHTVTDATLDELATRCRLTGGQIRNAAVHAALLALDAGRPVDNSALRAAVEREYASSGETSPLRWAPIAPSPFARAMATPGPVP
ncbi:MAG: hypothetical protein JWM12_1533, partial [Ilumatobacteraceae bacterium]|nr:hypothetical protein [Ilumatobacteraceae bacterium]